MESRRQPTLIVMLFPQYENDAEREVFGDLMRMAAVTVSAENVTELAASERQRVLGHTHTWLRNALSRVQGQATILLWNNSSEFLRTMSFFETLDQFVPAARDARKVAVVPNRLWQPISRDAGIRETQDFFEQEYHSMDVRKDQPPRKIFSIRLPPRSALTVSEALAVFLGTRAPQPLKRSDDREITQQVQILNPHTGEHKIPDPRQEEEEERPTVKPPAPDSPPSLLKPSI